MANWRLAESLKKLREEINAEFPTRSKISDGAIGDAAHASRASDHNPWVKDGATGVVTAIDITHDPIAGCTGDKLAAALVKSRDARIKYIIWNRRIIKNYPSQGKPAWTWLPYTGKNAHAHHLHISVNPEKKLYDSKKAWALDLDIAVVQSEPELKPVEKDDAIQQSSAVAFAASPLSQASISPSDAILSETIESSSVAANAAQAQSNAQNDAPQQTNESGAAATQVVVQPNALQSELSAPIVSAPGDPPIPSSTGSLKSLWTMATTNIAAIGAAVWAAVQQNADLLKWIVFIVGGIVGIYLLRMLILDVVRMVINSNPKRFNVK